MLATAVLRLHEETAIVCSGFFFYSIFSLLVLKGFGAPLLGHAGHLPAIVCAMICFLMPDYTEPFQEITLVLLSGQCAYHSITAQVRLGLL